MGYDILWVASQPDSQIKGKTEWGQSPGSRIGWPELPAVIAGSDPWISDSWFEGHFKYAADEIRNSLSAHLDLSQAKLLDFGCGDGITALGVALKSECPRLTGIDITRAFQDLPTLAQSQLGLSQVPPSLDFLQVEAGKAAAYRHPRRDL